MKTKGRVVKDWRGNMIIAEKMSQRWGDQARGVNLQAQWGTDFCRTQGGSVKKGLRLPTSFKPWLISKGRKKKKAGEHTRSARFGPETERERIRKSQRKLFPDVFDKRGWRGGLAGGGVF